MLLKDKDHLCPLKTCSVSAARSVGILLSIFLRNFILIARKKVTLSKNFVSTPIIARPEHFKLLLLSLQLQFLSHMPFLQVLHLPCAPARNYCTPKMVQQTLISALSAMGFQGKYYTKLWHVDLGAENHMTNTYAALCHVWPYDGQSVIQTTNGNSLPNTTVGDASSTFTNVIYFDTKYQPSYIFPWDYIPIQQLKRCTKIWSDCM